jgi:acyl carrier protein
MVSEAVLSDMVRHWVLQHGQTVPVHEDMDLIASGALDSMGFIELLVYIESITGRKIDLGDLDPSVFTSIQGLVRNVVMTHRLA